MSPTAKPGKDAAVEDLRDAEHGEAAARNDFVALFTQGMERTAELQKRAIDVAVQQQLELLDIYRKYGLRAPGAQRLPMLEVAGTMVERLADAQKHVIDLGVEQSRAWIDTFKDRAKVANKVTDAAAALTNEAVERSVAAQKKVVETTVAQTKAVLEATRQQLGMTGMPGESAISSFRKGVDTFVEAQKEILDLVTH